MLSRAGCDGSAWNTYKVRHNNRMTHTEEMRQPRCRTYPAFVIVPQLLLIIGSARAENSSYTSGCLSFACWCSNASSVAIVSSQRRLSVLLNGFFKKATTA